MHIEYYLHQIQKAHLDNKNAPSEILYRLLIDCKQAIKNLNPSSPYSHATLFKNNISDLNNIKKLLALYKDRDNYLFAVIEILNDSTILLQENSPLTALLSAFFSIYEIYRPNLHEHLLNKLSYIDYWNDIIINWIDNEILDSDRSDKHINYYRYAWVPKCKQQEILNTDVFKSDINDRNVKVDRYFYSLSRYADDKTCYKAVNALISLLESYPIKSNNLCTNINNDIIDNIIYLCGGIPEQYRSNVITQIFILADAEKITHRNFIKFLIEVKDWLSHQQKNRLADKIIELLDNYSLFAEDYTKHLYNIFPEHMQTRILKRFLESFQSILQHKESYCSSIMSAYLFSIADMLFCIISNFKQQDILNVIPLLLSALSNVHIDNKSRLVILQTLTKLQRYLCETDHLVILNSILTTITNELANESKMTIEYLMLLVELKNRTPFYLRSSVIELLLKVLYQNDDNSEYAAKVLVNFQDCLTDVQKKDFYYVFMNSHKNAKSLRWWLDTSGKSRELNVNTMLHLNQLIPKDQHLDIIKKILTCPGYNLRKEKLFLVLSKMQDALTNENVEVIVNDIIQKLNHNEFVCEGLIALKSRVPDTERDRIISKCFDFLTTVTGPMSIVLQKTLWALIDWFPVDKNHAYMLKLLQYSLINSYDTEIESLAKNYLNNMDILSQLRLLSYLAAEIQKENEDILSLQLLFTHVYKAYHDNLGIYKIKSAFYEKNLEIPPDIIREISKTIY